MTLSTYRKKRHFNRTPEPRGGAGGKTSKTLEYVIQKHDATRLHYDFRLELDGVLKSWAVPKGPSLDPSRKSLAVQVEDHPLEYGGFEGVIPKGEYGGGTVLLWDRGTWEPLSDPHEGLAQGKLHFILNGEKLHGEWALVQMHGQAGAGGKNWLLMKIKDKYAAGNDDVLRDEPESVSTKRSMEEIAGARDDVWSDEAKEVARIPGAVKAALPAKLSPQLAVLGESPPAGEAWVHEIKFDGYRILARINSGKVQLMTSHFKDWTAKFPGIARALAKLKVDSAILDGEAVVLDNQGRSDFQALQESMKDPAGANPVYYAFDLPFCDGFDLRGSPLIERKKLLQKIIEASDLGSRINFSEHVPGSGEKVVDKACAMGLEGIVSKQADSTYVSRREGTWIKSKCGQRQEFVIIGFSDPQGRRKGFGSLLLGYHDTQGRLVYAGRVGTGFNDKLLTSSEKRLRGLATPSAPTDLPPPARERRGAHWVKPQLVGEVKFTGWTRDGMLRHPVFVAFRTDKAAAEIVREIPVKPRKMKAEGIAVKKAEDAGETTIAGVRLTHPDKNFYGPAKTTKRDVAEYYQAVHEWMLPHVVNRPLALVRCPEGISAKCFFQRNWSETLPKPVGKVDVRQGKKEFHVTVSDLAGAISLVQMGVLEIHTWNCTNKDLEHPDQLIFDLDPGPGVAWKQIVESARAVKETLDSLKLPTFLKTSGGKGLHVTIPIEPNIGWDAAKSFCKTIANSLAEKSDRFVANMRKDLRPGKVYVDYNRNGRTATAVAPYSSRARADAPVSMPITWEELGRVKSSAQFTVESAPGYLDRRKKDPWADFEKSRVDLRRVVKE